MDKELRGNLNLMRNKMMDKSLYDKHKGSDWDYYATSEIRFKTFIPTKFLVGWMVKP